jgi:aspartate kinase
MKVLKFGGTSVGSPERMHAVAKLITGGERKIVILSAVSGTTNTLVEISSNLASKNKAKAVEIISNLEAKYYDFVIGLYATTDAIKKGNEVIRKHFETLLQITEKNFEPADEKIILAQGELISTNLFQVYLEEKNYKSKLLPALELMKIDEDNEPVLSFMEEKWTAILEQNPGYDLYISQGYICRNAKGEIDNLKRGGSDYTASLVGAAIRSSEIQIWTDIDGMHNNDPRIVKNTKPIAELSFDEAAELAYFGAKILHPSTIWPAQKFNIPVRLLNTMQPEAQGTLIATKTTEKAIKAIAAKDNIFAIKVKSSRMLLAYGFLRKIFEIFEKYKTPIDMITTSEVAVSVTIDNDTYLNQIVEELKQFGIVEVDKDQTIVCLVGNMVAESKGIVKKIFDAMADIPVRMISYGGSKHNISMLIRTENKNTALISLNEGLFD